MDIKQTNATIKLHLDEVHQPTENINPHNNPFATTVMNEFSFIEQIESVRQNISLAKTEFQKNINSGDLSPQKLM